MGKRWIVVLAVGIWIAGSLQGVSAQPAASGEALPRLVEEVNDLNRSMVRLVSLMERVFEQRRIDLVMRRIQLEESRIAPLRSRVRDLEDELDNRELEKKGLSEMLESQRDVLKDLLRAGNEVPDSERQMLDEVERHLKTMQREIDDRWMKLQLLENELAGRREDIEILDDALTELFESFSP